MPIQPEADLRERLEAVERKASRLGFWLVIVGGFAIFGDFYESVANAGFRAWHIYTYCNDVVEQYPNLDHTECMRRAYDAWLNDEDTIRVD